MAISKPRAEYEIGAKDDTKKGLSSAEKGLDKFGKASKAAFGVATAAAVAGVAAITAMVTISKKLTDAYAVQEKVELQMGAASRNNPMVNGDAVQGLFDAASALQQVSIYGDEALIPLMALGVNMGFTQTQIEGVSQAAVNLAASTGGSLDGAFKQIYKTLGGVGGELNETVAGMRDLTAEELKAGKGIELLNEQFGGMAEAMSKSTEGVKIQFQNLWGDVQESAGKAFAPLSRMMLNKIKPALEALGRWFEDNQVAITNFFLNFGEISRLTWEHIKKGFVNMFAWDNVIKQMKSFFSYMKTSFVNFGKFSWGIMKAVAKTIWSPLSKGFEYVVYGIKVGWQAMINGLATGINWLVENPIDSISVAFETVVHSMGEGLQWMINGVISGVNDILTALNEAAKAAHDNWQKIRHPFDDSKRSQYEGGEASQLSTMDIDWLDPKKHEQLTTNLDRFVSAVGDIPVPENEWEAIYNEIGSVWKDTAGDSLDLWLEQFEALKSLAGTAAEPFLEGFQGFSVKFNEIIARELPPEAQNLVTNMMAELQDSMTTGFAGSVSNMFGTGNRSWSALIDRIGNIFNDIGTDAVKFGKKLWKNMKSAGEKFVDAVKTPGESLGKLFTNISDGLAEAGHSFIDKLADLAENGFSDEFKQKITDGLKFAGSAMLSFGKWIMDNLIATEGMQELITKLTDSIGKAFEQVAGPLIEGLTPVIDALIGIAETSTGLLMPVLEAVANLLIGIVPLLDMFGQFIQQLLVPIMDILVNVLTIVTDLLAQIMPVIESILNMLLAVLIPILEFISEVLVMLAPVFELIGQLLVSLIPLFEALGFLLSEILTPALTFLGELLQAVLNPIMTVFAQIMTLLTPIFKIFAALMKAITPVFDIVFQLLSLIVIPLEILNILLTTLNPLFEILAWVLNLVIPIIGFFAKIIDAVTRPLEFLGDLAAWLGIALKAFGQALFYAITFQWGKFGEIEWPGSFSSDAFSRPLIDISSTNPADSLSTSPTDDITTIPDTDSSSDYSATAAQYGGTSVTFNVVVEAGVVVGDNGLQELAIILNDEYERANRLGIA